MNPVLRSASLAATFALLVVTRSLAQESTATSTPTPPPAPPKEPMNLARGFSGAGAFILDQRTRSFIANTGLAAVIDDDVASGWTPPTGKTTLLIQLSQEADVSGVRLYAPGAVGNYSLSVAESADAVANGQTTPIAQGIDLSQVNSTRIATTSAKYLVIEMEVAKSAPLRSVQAIGIPHESPTSSTAVVAPKAGADENESNERGEVAEVNFALKAVGGSTPVNPEEANALIDGDTATSSPLPANTKNTLIRLASAVEIDRIAIAVGKAVGQIALFANDGEGNDIRDIGVMKLDGKAEAVTIDTPGIRAEFVRLQWTPEAGSADLIVKEVGVFAQARVTRSEPPPGSSTIVVQVMPVFNSSTPSLPSPATIARATPTAPSPPPAVPPDPRPVSF